MSEMPDSREAVALSLARQIAAFETSPIGNGGKPKPSRKHLLDLYAECLRAVDRDRPEPH